MTDIRLIDIDAIDDAAIERDRTGMDEAALAELRHSIARSGLRMPVELCPLSEPRPPVTHALISGYRRLAAVRALRDLTGADRWRTIPAFVRPARTEAEAMAEMVEENEIRAELSPWERGRIAAVAVRRGVHDTVEQAVAALYPAADRYKQVRIRAIARLAEDLDGLLAAPERLSQQLCLRMAEACRKGFGEVIAVALTEAADTSHERQMAILKPILAEAEALPADFAPEPPRLDGRPTRPRRVDQPRRGLVIRREMTRAGWCLHFTGPEASSGLIDDVFDEIERRFGR